MRAAIIGTNWGLIYLQPLRQAGVEVVALCGRDLEKTAEIARREGVPHYFSDPRQLSQLPLDLIVVATPAISHAEILALFPEQWLICEKPLLGVNQPLTAASRLPRQRLWVNYAFAFLDTAQLAQQQLARLGPLKTIELHSEVRIPLQFSWPEWFLEVSSHPLSWLMHCLGPAWYRHHEVADSGFTLNCWWPEGTTGEARIRLADRDGIFHQLRVVGSGGEMSFSGELRWGESWRYSPLTVNGSPVNDGEQAVEDCWIRANHRAIQQILRVVRGELEPKDALAAGLFNADKALWLEQSLASD